MTEPTEKDVEEENGPGVFSRVVSKEVSIRGTVQGVGGFFSSVADGVLDFSLRGVANRLKAKSEARKENSAEKKLLKRRNAFLAEVKKYSERTGRDTMNIVADLSTLNNDDE